MKLRKPNKIFLLCLVPVCLNAGDIDGGFAGAFLRMGLGARALGLGGTFTAVADDGYAMYYNPAGLPRLTKRHVQISNRYLSLDRNFSYAGYAQSIKPSGGIGIGIIRTGVGDLIERNSTGRRLGTINYHENAFIFSFGIQVNPRVSIGLTGKYLYHQLHTIESKTFGLDAGLLFQLRSNLSIGVVIQDIGSKYDWNSNDVYERGSATTDEFPRLIRYGAAYHLPDYNVRIAAEIHKWTYSDALPHVGAEYTYRKKFQFRCGLNNNNFAAGFGLIYKLTGMEASLDFAVYSVENDAETAKVFSASFRF